jgi:hypothetical protein
LVKSSQSLRQALGRLHTRQTGGCGLQWAMHQHHSPVGWNGRVDVGWVVRIVSLISILPRGSNSECRWFWAEERKGNLSCSAMLPSVLRASETNSSTILHSVINIGDPNQFLSRTAINLGPQDGYHTFPSPAQVGSRRAQVFSAFADMGFF